MTNKHIILIAAFAPESGKSTFSEYLGSRICVGRPRGVGIYNFAKPVKALSALLLQFSGYTVEESYDALYRQNKEKEFTIQGVGQGITHRQLLQKTGTEYRHLLGVPSIWVDIAVNILQSEGGFQANDVTIIDDWRFIEEYEGISKFAAENNIKVHTVCIRNTKAEAKYTSNHASEGGLTNFKFDHIFWNNMDEEFFDQAFEFAKIFEVKNDDNPL